MTSLPYCLILSRRPFLCAEPQTHAAYLTLARTRRRRGSSPAAALPGLQPILATGLPAVREPRAPLPGGVSRELRRPLNQVTPHRRAGAPPSRAWERHRPLLPPSRAWNRHRPRGELLPLLRLAVVRLAAHGLPPPVRQAPPGGGLEQHKERPAPLGGGVGAREEVVGAESQEGERVRGEEVRGRDGTRGAARRGLVERRGAVRGRGAWRTALTPAPPWSRRAPRPWFCRWRRR